MGADLVREARRRAGLTQRQLADRAGSTQSAIARLESGRTAVGFDTVVRLVAACGFRLDVSLEERDDSDVAQAQRLASLSVDERVAENAAVVRFADRLAGAGARARQRAASGD